MEEKDRFTNEELAGKFKSNFDLVNYAIKLAENMIRTGRDARIKSDVQNRALLVLEEIVQGKDYFDEIKVAMPQSNENDYAGADSFKTELVIEATEETAPKRRGHVNFADAGEE